MQHAVLGPGTEPSYPADLTLESPFGRAGAAVRTSARLDRPHDVLWIGVKATQLAGALAQVPPGSALQAVVPLLNGIDHVALLRERFGAAVIPATIAVESERVAPGRIVHRSPFARLRVSARGTAALSESLAVLTRFGLDCAFVEDEATLLWSKLVFLAPIALATTAAQQTVDRVLASADTRAQLEACVREACAVAIAAGARVVADEVIRNIAGLPPGMKSSMQKDRTAGRPLELDAIAGPIIRGGGRFGIPVPATRALARAAAGA